MRVLPYGGRAFLVELDSIERVYGLVTALQRNPVDGVTEVVPAARTVLVKFDPDLVTGRALAERLKRRRPRAATWSAESSVELRVVYDGPDLAEVAMLTGLEPDDVINRHARADYTVAFCGFAPGFGYLVGGDPLLRVPRRPSPRTRVHGGSVALAGDYTGIYPRTMPGGWQLIGRTDAVLWDIKRDPPALLSPGTRVVFIPETAS